MIMRTVVQLREFAARTRWVSDSPALFMSLQFLAELKHTSTSYQLFDLSGFNYVKLSVGGDASASRSCPGMTPTVLRSDMESLLTTDFRRVGCGQTD